ncbi:hypothetical protein, partial [Nocardia wallacei]|uniref:hypothetical protein n=1 Tax=Nocardia wallacei TaxID=480035 RepID=UPI0024543FCF
ADAAIGEIAAKGISAKGIAAKDKDDDDAGKFVTATRDRLESLTAAVPGRRSRTLAGAAPASSASSAGMTWWATKSRTRLRNVANGSGPECLSSRMPRSHHHPTFPLPTPQSGHSTAFFVAHAQSRRYPAFSLPML